jgi:hypothetical protein
MFSPTPAKQAQHVLEEYEYELAICGILLALQLSCTSANWVFFRKRRHRRGQVSTMPKLCKIWLPFPSRSVHVIKQVRFLLACYFVSSHVWPRNHFIIVVRVKANAVRHSDQKKIASPEFMTFAVDVILTTSCTVRHVVIIFYSMSYQCYHLARPPVLALPTGRNEQSNLS